ncbi:MAG: hypothetical protein QXR34_07385 [Saccharolobus sp.]
MNKMLALGIILTTLLAGGIVIGEQVSGVLANISYTVISPQASIQTIPVSFNLGNLTAGQKGSLSENATITISTNGTYTIKLVEDSLDGVFSEFNVTIHIANYTFTLKLHGKHVYSLYLNKGTYVVNINISYVVSQNPASKSVSNAPFLIIKYGGEDNSSSTVANEHHHDKENDHDSDE